jgi:hypothetical protein
MKTPLIRQGEGQPGIIRIYVQIHEQHDQLDRMIQTANLNPDLQASRRTTLIGARSAAGDEARLRGIPAIGPGVAGAIPGTNPETIIGRLEAA